MVQSHPLRVFLFVGGWLSLILGCIGIFLPLLPTTPFILLAAFCFSRSSERLHQWLITHPQMGPLIQDWQHHGSISKSAKMKASVFMVFGFGVTFAVISVGLMVKGIIAVIGVSVLTFIWTRPVSSSEHIFPAKVAVE